MKDWHRVTMDPHRNPMNVLRHAGHFQIMLMFLMWTAVYSAAAGDWFLYEEIMILHMLVFASVLLAGATFRSVRNSSVAINRATVAPRATTTYGDRLAVRRAAMP